MPYKINIGTKEGKTFKLEADAPALEGKELGQTVKGEDVSPDLAGYEFEIKGASDKAGFTAMENVQGATLKKVLLSYEKGMKQRPKYEGKKVRSNPPGLRLRKTVRGKAISPAIVQINLKLVKEGGKKLSEIFPDQNKAPEPEAPAEETKAKPQEKTEAPKEEVKEEPKVEEDKANPEKEPQTEAPAEPPEEEPKSSEKDVAEGTQPDKEPSQ